jgi:peptidoglycan/LPS O-acetylase OafA/YrhL
VSFGLYVSHEMLGWRLMAAAESAGLPRVAAILLALLCALLLADLITRLVEQPALHAIRRAWRRA